MAFPSGYTKYQEVVIDATKVSADLTDYVIYVDLSTLDKVGADIFDTVRSDGGDIRVTKSDGTTQLPREVVFIDTVNKKGELHIKYTGVLSSTTNTTIRIWYNGVDTEPAATDPYGRNNVWSGYKFVAHLQEDPSGSAPQIIDSTGNYHGTTSGTMTTSDSVAGALSGNALDFDGIDDYVNHGGQTGLDVTTGDVSVTCWYKLPDTSGNDAIFAKASGTSTGAGYQIYSGGSSMYAKVADGSAYLNTSNAFTINTWYYYVYRYQGSTGTLSSSHNAGAFDTASNSALGSISDTAQPFYIGRRGSGLYAKATIDEVRIRFDVVSQDWISTEYNNQSSPSTFYSTSDELTSGGGGGGGTNSVSVFDTVATTETTSLQLTLDTQIIIESIPVTESTGQGLTIDSSNIFDQVVINESINNTLFLIPALVADSVTTSESVNGVLSYELSNIFDQLIISEYNSNLLSLGTSLNEQISVTESVSSVFTLVSSAIDTVLVTDSLLNIYSLFIADVYDLLNTQESITSMNEHMLSINESVSVNEHIQNSGSVYFIDVYDSLTIGSSTIGDLIIIGFNPTRYKPKGSGISIKSVMKKSGRRI